MERKLILSVLCYCFIAVLALILPAGAAIISEVEPNDSLATAQNIDPYFSLEPNAVVNNPTTIPWVQIQATGNGTHDYYSFNVPTANVTALFDIDYGMYDLDSWLNLWGPGGYMGAHDDGMVLDPGTVHPYDSFWQLGLPQAGDYTIRVGSVLGIHWVGVRSLRNRLLAKRINP